MTFLTPTANIGEKCLLISSAALQLSLLEYNSELLSPFLVPAQGSLLDFLKSDEGNELGLATLIDMTAQV